MDFEEIADKLEPLGTNCELGFLLEQLGTTRSSLFRFLLTPFSGLLHCIENDFEDFLWPVAPHDGGWEGNDMVMNTKTSIAFHAPALRSTCIQLSSHSEPEMHRLLLESDVYLAECQKYDHLIEKFRNSIGRSDVFHVYLDLFNSVSDSDAAHLKELLVKLDKPADSSLLIIKDCSSTSDLPPAVSVRHLSNQTFVGTLPRFAPTTKSYDIDMDSWKLLLASFWEQKG